MIRYLCDIRTDGRDAWKEGQADERTAVHSKSIENLAMSYQAKARAEPELSFIRKYLAFYTVIQSHVICI